MLSLVTCPEAGSRVGPIPQRSLGWVRLWGRWGLLRPTEAPPPVVKGAGVGPSASPHCLAAGPTRALSARTVSAHPSPPRPAPTSERSTPGPWGVGAAALLPSGAESAGPQLGGGSDHPLAGTLPAILPNPSPQGLPKQDCLHPQWEDPPKSRGARERRGSSR